MHILIAGQKWDVLKVSGHDPGLYADAKTCLGTAWPGHLRIYISAELEGDSALRTIKHELVHAYIYSTQAIRPETWDEEDVCEFLSIYGDEIIQQANLVYTKFFADQGRL